MARPERGRFLLKEEGLHDPLGVGQLLLLAGWDQLGLWVLEDRGQAGPQGVATLRLTLGRRDQDGAEVGQVLIRWIRLKSIWTHPISVTKDSALNFTAEFTFYRLMFLTHGQVWVLVYQAFF